MFYFQRKYQQTESRVTVADLGDTDDIHKMAELDETDAFSYFTNERSSKVKRKCLFFGYRKHRLI